MTTFVKMLTAAALVGGLPYPAAAQYQQQYPYPQQQTYPGYGGQPGYGYPQQGYGQNPVGDIVDHLLGNRYNVTDRQAVRRCASAATAQAAAQYGGGYNQSYGQQYGYNQRYNRGYGYGAARVTAITNVERRSYGMRVSGLMSNGVGYGGYGNQGYYGNRTYGSAQLSFRCNVDYRGVVTGVRVRPSGSYGG
jgi:hypothetical protein